MDIGTLRERTADFFQKYKYVILIVLIGLVLMAVPVGHSADEANPDTEISQTDPVCSIDSQLESLLRQIKGAGEVRVMVSIASGEQILYQTDKSQSGSDITQSNTVTITDAQRAQNGLIQQINPPTYLGAIVLCQGADSPAVRLAMVDAVSKVTGLGAGRISVLKMK